MKRLHFTTLAAIFALGLSSCAPTAQAQQQESEQRQSQQAQQQRQESYTDFPTSDGDEPSEFNLTRTPDPSKIKVPDGYKVEVLTTDLSYATDITFGPNGVTTALAYKALERLTQRESNQTPRKSPSLSASSGLRTPTHSPYAPNPRRRRF